MKERPIIMSQESVQTILAGRKTQTRRVCKYPLDHNIISSSDQNGFTKFLFDKWRPAIYQIGDRLWVKEKYGYDREGALVFSCNRKDDRLQEWAKLVLWKNPMFMPKRFSRLTLDVRNVRFEKLQNMTITDAVAEGFSTLQAYHETWDTLNAKRGFPWKSNPWVWVIEFKRI